MKLNRYTSLNLLFLMTLLTGCKSATSVETVQAQTGTPSTMALMLASMQTPGPIKFEKHLAAHWSVPLSGLLNLEHPKAIDAGLEDKEEAIEIYVYSIVHPTAGTFIVDSGMSERFINPEDNPDISAIVKLGVNTEALEVKRTTASLAEMLGGIDGVLLTHIHMDHIMGLRDLPKETPVYIGPGDAGIKAFMNMFTQGTTDRLLSTQNTLREWQFDSNGILDVFGDGSLYAIHAPGHTPGATAYLARTTEGPQLMIGDVTHTKWGWEHGVEPGTYSENAPESVVSLEKIQTLASMMPDVVVHPGHQSL